jgi:outer membrane protein TolC
MSRAGWRGWAALALLGAVGIAPGGAAQEPAPAPRPLCYPDCPPPVPVAAPAPTPCDRPLPINLPTALHLAGVRPLDVALASERIRVATAELERAEVLWLPTVYLGADYFRHDGQIQDVGGNVFTTSKSSLLVGAGPSAVFAVTDAVFAPLAQRQVVRAREAGLQAARNDSLLAVAEAYFSVQQARGELAGAADAARRTAEVVRRTRELAGGGEGGILAEVDVVRARTEFARRDQALDTARERWRVASADVARVLRLDPGALVEPLESPHLRVTLVAAPASVDELIPVGLTNRPELAAQQALVQATLVRLRQERLRPLIPSVLLRGASTNPAGTLGGGYFGGGLNDDLTKFSARGDFDVQVLWELQNLGFGNKALVDARRAENQLSVLELFRLQDRVAAEVAQAYAQVRSAATRLGKAESGLKDAVESADKNFEGLGQTKTVLGKPIVLVIRPQEVVAAVQALAQAYDDYFAAVADYNRAQFRLYRALGQPAQLLAGQEGDCPGPQGQPPPPEPTGARPLPPPQATRPGP